MRLRTIDPRNYEAALEIEVRPDQGDLVAPVVKSLAEAYVFGDRPGRASSTTATNSSVS